MNTTKKNPSYEELIKLLELNHFYAGRSETGAGDKRKITEIHVECSPIMQDSKEARLKEVLKDWPVVVSRDTNNQVIRIKFKK